MGVLAVISSPLTSVGMGYFGKLLCVLLVKNTFKGIAGVLWPRDQGTETLGLSWPKRDFLWAVSRT